MKSDTTASLRFKKATIPYAETGFFGKIVLDYLANSDALKPFYNYRPELNAFAEAMEIKAADYRHRKVLVEALTEQYGNSGLKQEAIAKLSSPNTFTVTTGHQVCLFTGPLYFVLKIISTVNTCQKLKQQYPDKEFVPVFWMATEDHDFEEANHFYLPQGKIEWESGQGGAVGRMKPVGMEEIADELKSRLGVGYRSAEILKLFEDAYLNSKNIADATRKLVHRLFGSMGVVVVDGDDAKLKALAVDAFAKELREETSAKAMNTTNKALEAAGYDLQVNPREINLFYLDEELRERIERKGEGYVVVNTKLEFTKAELLDILHKHPEHFSPNVVLRPLYQEIVLPNLAYIGGGGELAYWFQLKGVFDDFQVPFPVLMLRNSAMVMEASIRKYMDGLGIELRDLFTDEVELENRLVKAETEENFALDAELERLEALFLDIEARLRKVEGTLEKSVRSGYARSERIVKNLEKKMLRAERKKQEILLGRLQKVRDALFPRGGLQERNLNFTPFYLSFGPAFFETLRDQFDPFEHRFTILEEEV